MGRPIPSRARPRLGIDLGGTKIEVAALDLDGGFLLRRRVPTPRAYEATLETLARLVREVERDIGPVASIGVGTPGATSPATGLIKNANSTWLNGRPLAADLRRQIGRPVRLANDADCFTLSEATDGAGKGARVVFGVILGTGVGGGIVVRGRLLGGPNAVAGEWGHNPLPWPEAGEWPGPRCYCGKTGCIETFLSGPGLVSDHRAHGGAPSAPEGIVSAAESGDPGAGSALARYVSRLGRALAGVINLLDPDVIVLGGGLSCIARLYAEVPPVWTVFAFSDRVDTRLIGPEHGDSSGVRGAAWLGATTDDQIGF